MCARLEWYAPLRLHDSLVTDDMAEPSSEMTFVFKYPEHNGRSDGADPWSIRQTGVYQGFDPLTRTSLWMLLNPRRNAAADTRIRGMLNDAEGSPQLHQQPPLIGLVVLSTYFANWRTYMEFYEQEELRMVGNVPLPKGLMSCCNIILSHELSSEQTSTSSSTLATPRYQRFGGLRPGSCYYHPSLIP